MREQFHTEWERAVKNKMMWIAVFIGCLLAIAQTVFEVYPYARNPLMFYRGSDGQPASLFMYWFGLNSGSPYKVTFFNDSSGAGNDAACTVVSSGPERRLY